MKKLQMTLVFLMLVVLLTGCGKPQPITTENVNTIVEYQQRFLFRITGLFFLGFINLAETENGKDAYISGYLQGADGPDAYILSMDMTDRRENVFKTRKKISGIKFSDLDLSPGNDTMAVGASDGRVYVWDMDGEEDDEDSWYSLPGHTDAVYSVAWSPDGRLLASGGADSTVRIWNMGDEPYEGAEKNEEVTCLDMKAQVRSVSFSPKGDLVLVATAKQLCVVYVDSWKYATIQSSLLGELAASICWTPDGSKAAVGTYDGKVVVFCFENELSRCIVDHYPVANSGIVRDMSYSPDAAMLAVDFEDSLVIVNTADRKVLKKIEAPAKKYFSDLAWSADGSYIAVVYTDCTMRLWGLE